MLFSSKFEFYRTTVIKNTDIGSDFELGGAVGVSYKIKAGLFGSLRYVHGFTAAIDRESTYDEDAKNTGFSIRNRIYVLKD